MYSLVYDKGNEAFTHFYHTDDFNEMLQFAKSLKQYDTDITSVIIVKKVGFLDYRKVIEL